MKRRLSGLEVCLSENEKQLSLIPELREACAAAEKDTSDMEVLQQRLELLTSSSQQLREQLTTQEGLLCAERRERMDAQAKHKTREESLLKQVDSALQQQRKSHEDLVVAKRHRSRSDAAVLALEKKLARMRDRLQVSLSVCTCVCCYVSLMEPTCWSGPACLEPFTLPVSFCPFVLFFHVPCRPLGVTD